ncbi:MAG: formate dehydrogenase accessory sulfurtransferase FdhD, partial [Gemmatimonadetes bacterium]|nr:formate dehydrogenase accessory sulfurtransferase FdhD [Gemmatimonadota bacterium]
YIRGVADILSLSVIYDPPGCIGVRVRVPNALAQAADAIRVHRAAHGCGSRHDLDCNPAALAREQPPPRVPLPAFPDLFRDLYANADRYHETGGMHTAALSDGTDLRYQVEDVARHNAVDRAIGWAVLEDAERGPLGLILSARVSAEIALKAARAGLAWVASRSIATDLAVEIATAAALPIVARAASKDAKVFGVLLASADHPAPAVQSLPEQS